MALLMVRSVSILSSAQAKIDRNTVQLGTELYAWSTDMSKELKTSIDLLLPILAGYVAILALAIIPTL